MPTLLSPLLAWGGQQGSVGSFPRTRAGLGTLPKATAVSVAQQGTAHSWKEDRWWSRATGLSCVSPSLLPGPLLTETWLWALAGTEHSPQQS